MTLLITIFAAIICTVIWYAGAYKSNMKVGFLCWLYWGASIMWFVDAIFKYAEIKAKFFSPAPLDMLNDSFLGLSVVAFGLLIWLINILITDPKGVIRENLFKKVEKTKLQSKN
jgi:hypothetical protein